MATNDVAVLSQPLIPIFKGGNYHLWSLKMKTLFISQDLWDMVEQGYGEPEEAPRENRKKDAKALLFIQSAVDDEIFLRISTASTSKQAWDIIQKEYFGDKKENAKQKQQEYDAAAGMEEELYSAATSGSIEEMRGIYNWKDQQTPTYNNVLHLHVGNSRFNTSICSRRRYAMVDFEFIDYVLDDDEGYWLMWKQNSNGDTPLHLAARFGHSNAVEAFLKRAKKVYQPADEVTRILSITNTKKDTALHEAARAGYHEVVKLLVPYVPYCSSHTHPNDNRETPLYLAAESGSTPSVRSILPTCDASHVAYKGPCDRTPLHAAVQLGSREMVNKILERDRSLLMRIQDEEGLTPLHSAALEKDKIDHLKILLKEDKQKKESSVAYLQDNMGRTSLHIAMLRRNVGALDALIKSCPDCVEIGDHKGQNVLHTAATWGFQDVINWVVKRALQLDKYINKKDNDGDTPLHIFATYVKNNPDVPFVSDMLKSILVNFPSVDKKAFNKKNCTVGDILHPIARLWSPSKAVEVLKLPRGRRENSYESEIKIDLQIINYDAGEWDVESMKKTAQTGLVVATLIATVSFAAAVTVPGGSDEKTGKPVLEGDYWFNLFIAADGIAFVSSSSAIVVYFIMASPSQTAIRMHTVVGLSMNTVALGALMVAFIAAMGAVEALLDPHFFLLTTYFVPYYCFLIFELVCQFRFLFRRLISPFRVLRYRADSLSINV